MGRPMKREPHLTIEEIKEKLHTIRLMMSVSAGNSWSLTTHWLTRVQQRPLPYIRPTSLWFVYHTVSDYNRRGPASIEEDGCGGRHHAYLTEAEEVAFLESLHAQAEAGEVVTTHTIKQAFEQRVGHEVHPDTITNLLHQHRLGPSDTASSASQERPGDARRMKGDVRHAGAGSAPGARP